ncbi:unnamed protein product [Dovyalis caffra]|uniref:Pentatricopeptide repeat-containing protein n=1 Tax=Dovyalis caffra TaxID=77055 RepID=A0AAV1S045_9ROSI|nr:unnamed protein product [Dovyalis caffra]
MKQLLILGSSIVTPPTSPSSTPHHHQHSPKPKTPSPHTLHASSKPTPAVHSRSSPLLSTIPFRQNQNSSSLLSYYANLASKLAEDGRLQDFLMIAESVIASGVEASSFVAALSANPVAKGISKNLQQGNVDCVVQFLKKTENLGVSTFKFLDGVAIDLLKKECLRIVNFGDVEQVVGTMETLAGFCFSFKELVDPSYIIKICVDKRNPKMAVRYAAIFPGEERIFFCNIISEFGRKRDLDSALVAYNEAKHKLNVPNMYLHRTIIDVCGLCGDYMKSRYIYEDLLNQKVIPNIYVFNSLMNVNAHDLGYTFSVHKNMQNLGVTADVASYNILLKTCCISGRVDLAKDIYREAKQLESAGLLKLDVFTYCMIIKVFADAKMWQMALKIKEDMLSSEVAPNMHIWSSLMSACANAGLVEEAIQLFEEMLLSGCEPNSQCCNILLHACVEACQYDRAFRLFQCWKGSEVQEVFHGNHSGNTDKIEHTQKHCTNMPDIGPNSHHLNFIKKFPFTPTSTTYHILMKACGSDYHRAKALMDEMKMVGISPNHISWSILIDICGGSGSVAGAVQILKTMRMAGVEPDVVAYTTAIKVCVETKNLKLAFSLFAEMKRYQIKPNLVTYNTLLRARTKYGSLHQVQQCLAIYQDMRKAGYKSNDYYLKQLIEEWCEGVIQDDNQSQDGFASYKKTDLGRPHSLLLEKVAVHLQNNIAKNLAIDLQGLTKVSRLNTDPDHFLHGLKLVALIVEARIVVLAVLRMIKENYALGYSVEDDMWITLDVSKVYKASNRVSEVKNAMIELLQNELGLEVLIAFPGYLDDIKIGLENPLDLGPDWEVSSARNKKMASSTRRPIVGAQRLKVTRKSLHKWLHRKVGAIGR